jgi:hypothetical protein
MILLIKPMGRRLLMAFMILLAVGTHRNLLLPQFADGGIWRGRICIRMLKICILPPMAVAVTAVETVFGKRSYRNLPMKRA